MLVINYLTSTVGILLVFTSLVSTLPVLHPITDDSSTLNETDFFVDLNRLTNILSAHIMTEHVDNAIMTLSKSLAAHIQSSVQLDTHASHNDEDVDIRLLKEQIQGAVGSYVQDQLPSMWYRGGLDSIHSFLETSLVETCEPVEGVIPFGCLQSHADRFSTLVDAHVKHTMHATLADIVQKDLPQLLTMTDHHIRAVLNHFNTFLLPPHCQLSMHPLSLQDHLSWSDADNINAILDSVADGETSYSHSGSLVHSIHQYAILSKSTSLHHSGARD
ncbi:hypothetical protein BC941DRAFT_426533 [Chlamydoabsidia padenii]|nr:hypothetical protein BC941DRAFT_426533 [Chlamydoabsidia padenii]